MQQRALVPPPLDASAGQIREDGPRRSSCRTHCSRIQATVEARFKSDSRQDNSATFSKHLPSLTLTFPIHFYHGNVQLSSGSISSHYYLLRALPFSSLP